MVSLEQLVGLALACVLLVAVPGPSVLFVVGRALASGRTTALASVAGNCTGAYLAAVCVALGVGPLLERSDLLFHLIRALGAAYLVWLGVQALRRAGSAPAEGDAAVPQEGLWRAVRAGVLVGVTNPKTFVVFAAVLPPFVDRAAGAVPQQMLLLALVPVAIGMVTDSAWAVAAARARTWLASSPRRARTVARAGGLSMIALGASVAVTGRRL